MIKKLRLTDANTYQLFLLVNLKVGSKKIQFDKLFPYSDTYIGIWPYNDLSADDINTVCQNVYICFGL